jgi:hypothetical protein
MVEVNETLVHEAMLTKSSSSWDENVITLKSLVRILDRETTIKKLIDEDTNQ